MISLSIMTGDESAEPEGSDASTLSVLLHKVSYFSGERVNRHKIVGEGELIALEVLPGLFENDLEVRAETGVSGAHVFRNIGDFVERSLVDQN